MLLSFILFWLAITVNLTAFFGLRYLVARIAGLRGIRSALGIDRTSWAPVPMRWKIAFALAGPVGCYLSAALFLTAGSFISGTTENTTTVYVTPNGPAAAAGILDGDKVVAIDDVAVQDWSQLREQVQRHAGLPVRVALRRSGQDL